MLTKERIGEVVESAINDVFLYIADKEGFEDISVQEQDELDKTIKTITCIVNEWYEENKNEKTSPCLEKKGDLAAD